jgi:hypothetical protein
MAWQIADACRQKIHDDRLRAVAEHVRGWLFSQAKPQIKGQEQTEAPAKQELAHLRLFTA